MERLLAERLKSIYSKRKKKKSVPNLFTTELNKVLKTNIIAGSVK